ncbi:MAG TPA: hypothetical protein VH087_06455, partial [Thermoanaerobaculia bacterium]|nr:hypothetical protein [Thermoanaerobaculia bacterium]
MQHGGDVSPILDIFPPNLDVPLRVELFDNIIERIREFDPSSQRSV